MPALILLGSNLKQGFTKPFRTTHKDWGKFAVVEGAMGFAGKPIQRNELSLRNRSTGVRNIGKKLPA